MAYSGTKRTTGHQYLLTLTAVGRDRHRMPSGTWCSCTTEGNRLNTPERMARWNATHSARWNHFRTTLRREYPDLQFMRGVEVQQRGALHDHAMVWSPVPLSMRVVRELAMRAGFGHSVDLAPAEPGSKRAAYYVSKYVTKATDSREDVPWWGETVDVDQDTGEVTTTEGIVAGRYRTWSASRDWGDTMADARASARAYVNEQQLALEREALATLWLHAGAQPLPDDIPPAHPA